MSREAAFYQALSACGAVLIAFIGVCHEVIGHILFPWGPAVLGGPIGWHTMGIFAIGAGLLVLAGTLQLIKFPVVLVSLIAAIVGFGLVIVTAIVHHQFHMFALATGISGAVTAFCHPRATVAQQSAYGSLAASPE